MRYLVGHYNGCSYCSDGEEWVDIDSIDDITREQLIENYSTDADGDPCDVRLICEITDGTEDEYGQPKIIKTIKVDWSAGEDAQDMCHVIASMSGEYHTSYVGTDLDDNFVTWTNNGGNLGAHDRMTNDGWREIYEAPEKVDAAEFLKLCLEYGYDLHDDVDDLCGLVGESIGHLRSETDVAYYLGGDDSLITIEAHGHKIGTRHILLWTDCDGVGIDDAAIREYDEGIITEFAEKVAASIGEVVDVESGSHYTNEGIQYQPSQGYDRDGYEIIIVRREEGDGK